VIPSDYLLHLVVSRVEYLEGQIDDLRHQCEAQGRRIDALEKAKPTPRRLSDVAPSTEGTWL
jgi:hypothetical protein